MAVLKKHRLVLIILAATILVGTVAIIEMAGDRRRRFYAFAGYLNGLRHFVHTLGDMPCSLRDIESEYNSYEGHLVDLPSPPLLRRPIYRPVKELAGGPYLVFIEPKPEGFPRFKRYVIYSDAKVSSTRIEVVWEWQLDDLIRSDDLLRIKAKQETAN